MFLLKYSPDAVFTFASCGNLINKSRFLHSNRLLDTFVLLIGVEGILHIMQDHTPYALGKNQYLILFPGMRHRGIFPSEGSLNYYWCHFYIPCGQYEILEVSDNITTAQNSHDFSAPDFGAYTHSSRIHLSFRHLIDSYKSQQNRRILDLMITTIVSEIACGCSSPTDVNQNPSIERIMDYINSNYALPLTVANLAELIGYNANYLSLLFRRTTGQTLSHYINQTRINAAKGLLLNSSALVKSIAYQVGFNDEKHFMKVFHTYEKMTPSEFRNTFMKNHINER